MEDAHASPGGRTCSRLKHVKGFRYTRAMVPSPLSNGRILSRAGAELEPRRENGFRDCLRLPKGAIARGVFCAK